MLSRLRFLLAGLLVAATALGAQARGRPPLWQPAVGLHFGTPQRASLAIGVLWVAQWSPDFSEVRGPRMIAEPGLRAGKLRAGYAASGAFATGWALEAAAMREWGGERREATLYGGEAHASLMFVDLGVGLYAHPGGRRRLALSLGLVL
jgi:hypothetical protein